MMRITVAFASLVLLVYMQPTDSAAQKEDLLLETIPEDAEEAVAATKKWGKRAYASLNRRQLIFLLHDKEDQHKRLRRLLQVLVIAGYVLAAMTFFYDEGRQIVARVFDLPPPESPVKEAARLRQMVADLEKRLSLSMEKGEAWVRRESELKALATSETVRLEEQLRLLREEMKEKEKRFEAEQQVLQEVIDNLAEMKIQKLDELDVKKRPRKQKAEKEKEAAKKTDRSKHRKDSGDIEGGKEG